MLCVFHSKWQPKRNYGWQKKTDVIGVVSGSRTLATFIPSPEGQTAPLVRFDIHDAPNAVKFEKPLHFTPTFILVSHGTEVGRIEGYPGEDFFWSLLGLIFKDQNISLDQGE